jgi:hypothetical protein
MSKRFRTYVSCRHLLQPIIAHRRGRSKRGFDIALIRYVSLFSRMGPDGRRSSQPGSPIRPKGDSPPVDLPPVAGGLYLRYRAVSARDGQFHEQ